MRRRGSATGGAGSPAAGYFDPTWNAGFATYRESDRTFKGSGTWSNARSLNSQAVGKWYAEIYIIDQEYNYSSAIGLATAAYTSTDALVGNNSISWGMQSSDNITGARLRHNNAYAGTAITPAVTENSYMRVAVDFNAGKAWFGNSTAWIGGGDPATGTSPTFTFTPNTPLYLIGGSSGSIIRLATKTNELLGVVPTGFDPWGGTGGTAPATIYRYWEVFVTANNGDGTFTSIAELILRVAGFDVTAGGTASASTDHFGVNGSRAFDKNTGAPTTWVTNAGAHLNCWVRYDFGAGKGKAIDTYGLYGEPGLLGRAPKDFTLRASNDASSWTTKDTQTNITGWAGGVEKAFNVP